MPFVNCGALFAQTNQRIPTKKALRIELRTKLSNVVFDKTSPLDRSDTPASMRGDRLPTGVKFSVCGPNPYSDRKWWAIVEKMPNGSVRVE